MWLVTSVLLILLGLLGIAGWLKAQRPDAGRRLQPIEQFEGWIGAAGLVWGILLLLRWLSALGVMYSASGAMLVTLITALVIIALSLVLALPLLRSMFGSGDFMTRLGHVSDRVLPYKIGLGFACFVLALYSLVGNAF
ncbi:MAG TPA: hypothetical protein VGO25_11410 [Rhodanobacteraceae bacterium]|jgi:hypothetical protein|nr:hypothetical protein [Rhodanobacteraceae bacterium]